MKELLEKVRDLLIEAVAQAIYRTHADMRGDDDEKEKHNKIVINIMDTRLPRALDAIEGEYRAMEWKAQVADGGYQEALSLIKEIRDDLEDSELKGSYTHLRIVRFLENQ